MGRAASVKLQLLANQRQSDLHLLQFTCADTTSRWGNKSGLHFVTRDGQASLQRGGAAVLLYTASCDRFVRV